MPLWRQCIVSILPFSVVAGCIWRNGIFAILIGLVWFMGACGLVYLLHIEDFPNERNEYLFLSFSLVIVAYVLCEVLFWLFWWI